MSQKNDSMLVKDYMSARMVTINKQQSVLDVAKRMTERNVSSVVITDDKDRIVGILTERDIVRSVTNGVEASRASASSLMTHPVVSIEPDLSIEDAARIMAQKKVRHLMVQDPSSQQVIGIITLTDFARYIKQNLADEEIVASEVWELFF
jgi:signal-transduction protein with cAMP-binding, CBS, and nucleotidyltransferase domain